MRKCEGFSRSIFTKVIKTFIKDHLVVLIKELVEKFIGPLKLKFDIQKDQLEVLLNHLNSKIMQRLFQRDEQKVREYEKYIAMDLSNDSLDEDNVDNEPDSKREPQPWLFETLIDILEKETGAEAEEEAASNALVTSLKNELLDLLESDYFQSSLFESMQSSFKHCIQ